MKRFNLLIPFFLVLLSCDDWVPDFGNTDVQALKPVYFTEYDTTVTVLPPQKIVSPQKLFSYENLMFVNEKDKGFHVFDNSNPAFPVKKYFISVPSSTDIVIKDDVMYANMYGKLVVMTFDADTLIVHHRLDINLTSKDYPPFENVYYECPDPSKGDIKEWIPVVSDNAFCFKS